MKVGYIFYSTLKKILLYTKTVKRKGIHKEEFSKIIK